MIEYNYIHFINLEYWYCIFYSLFGGTCTALTVGIEGAPSVLDEEVVNTGATLATSSVSLWGSLGSIFGTSGAVIVGIAAILWAFYSAIAYTVSGLLIILIVVALSGLLYIRYKELSFFATLPTQTRTINPLKSRWEALLEDATSNDPKRWRRGIVEADTMLGEVLAKLGYRGQTTAERLRSVPDAAFVTLPAAWEAHRVKNFVVARLSNYILTQRESFRVMKLYEQVFEEFDFI